MHTRKRGVIQWRHYTITENCMNEMNAGQGQNNQQKPSLSWSAPSSATKPAIPPVSFKNNTNKQQPNPGNGSKAVFILAAGVLACGLAAWGWWSLRPEPREAEKPAPSAPASVSTPTQTGALGGNISSSAPTGASIAVGDMLVIPSPQAPGMQVAVNHVAISEPTWVVVYESHNGVPGNVLGAGLFLPARTSGVVELLRGTLPGQTYIIGESIDDGDRQFSMQNDKVVRATDGNPALATFSTN